MPHFSKYEIKNTIWNIRSNYVDLCAAGSGVFGLHCTAFDKNGDCEVYMKKFPRLFDSIPNVIQAYRELMLLKHLSRFSHDNILKMLDVFTDCEQESRMFNDLYIVTEPVLGNLHSVIQINQLKNEQIQFLTYQLLRGLKFLHSANIIHRDLKPSNISVDENCGLKITNFGLARQEGDKMTGYVVTRWYRAPEVLLQWTKYSTAIDMWACACILFEMHTRRPLFPAKDCFDHLKLIFNIVGYSDESVSAEIPLEIMKSLLVASNEQSKRVNFQTYFEYLKDTNAIDLLDKLITLNPDRRMSAEQALEHLYVLKYHDKCDEPTCEIFNDSFENEKHSIEEWRERLFNETKKQ